MITRQDIEAAHLRIQPYVTNTPVLTSDVLDELVGAKLYFKCENLQKIGAFKARGAMNAILSLAPDALSKGVATHSSGNHAQALARAAKLMGVKSYIVMPHTAPEIKKRGVRSFGGEIFECEPTLSARESTLAEIVQRTGATEIHPFNNYEVMTGQATASKELFEAIPMLDIILAPVGGGGLLSGTAMSTKYFSESTTVWAAEPEGADDAYRSLISGKIEPSQSDSVADGLLTTLGDKTFPVIHDNVKRIVTVSDNEIIAAMKLVWEDLKMIVEPSGAVTLAAVIKARADLRGKKVGLIISGGNVDLDRAMKLFQQL